MKKTFLLVVLSFMLNTMIFAQDDFNCAGDCGCEITLTITNSSESPWDGVLVSRQGGVVTPCQGLAVPGGGSVTYSGIVSAVPENETDIIQYLVRTINGPQNNPAISIDVSSSCLLKSNPSNVVFWLFNPDCNEDLGPGNCDFTIDITGEECLVCFTSTNPGSDPEAVHDWDFNSDGVVDVSTTNETVCYTYPDDTDYPVSVTHNYLDQTCSMTVGPTGCEPPTCEELEPDFSFYVDCMEEIYICVYIDGAVIDDDVTVSYYFANGEIIQSFFGCVGLSSEQLNQLGTISVFIGDCEYVLDENTPGWPSCPEMGGYAPDRPEIIELYTDLSLFPNPATDQFRVHNPTETNLVGVLQNIDGKEMQIFNLAAYETTEVMVDQIPDGIYFVKISNPISKESVRVKKVIISH